MAVKAAFCFSARLLHTGELDLGLLCSLRQALQCLPVLEEVDALRRPSLTLTVKAPNSPKFFVLSTTLPGLGLLEVFRQPVHDDLVKVVAAQVGVAVGGEHLADSVADLQHRDVEGSSSEIEDQNRLVVRLLQAICQGGSSRLVHNSQHVQTSNLPGILRGLN